MLKADAVFQGGGVKGIGLVGALCFLEKRGYTWNRVAGTSAGAIIASMVAAGYSGKEMKNIMDEINYKDFTGDKSIKNTHIFNLFNFLTQKGVYGGEDIEVFIRGILRAKGKTKFKDVSVNGQSKLKIIAADISKKDMIILPDDLPKYNIDPMEFDIAKAVRMSISIPFLFKPVKLEHKEGISYVVDGGILSNFPVWIFDVAGMPRWPTFGFKLVEEEKCSTTWAKKNIISYAVDIVDTMIDKDELRYIKNKDFVRIIRVPSMGVKTTEFDISKDKSDMLYTSGYKAAEKFIGEWSFQRYVENYRSDLRHTHK